MDIQVAVDYLGSRGLTPEDVDKLGIQISGLHPEYSQRTVQCVIFHHFDREGTSLDWYSSRLLAPAVEMKGLMAQTNPRKQAKTHCPTGERSHGYFPQNYDWSKLGRGDRVFICESPLKAAVICKLGYPAIGLNGVAGYSQNKFNVLLVPEIKELAWRAMELTPVILFDSDAQDNESIGASIQRLGVRLRLYCGVQAVQIFVPPGEDGEKQGIDDYLVGGGDVALLTGEGEPVTGDEVRSGIADLNEEVVYVNEIHRIVTIESPLAAMMTGPTFSKLAYANRVAHIPHQTADRMVPVSIAEAWIKSDARRTVQKLDYVPDGPSVVDGDYVNLWTRWGVPREVGDASFFTGFIDYLLPVREQAEYFLNWLAWPLQNPGGRMTVATVLVGNQGIGKTRLMDLMGNIYGSGNSVQLGGSDLEEKHNTSWPMSQFINLDEIGRSRNPRATMDLLKRLITSNELIINPKHGHPFKVVPKFNICVTTNHWDSLKMDADDRRFWVGHAAPVIDVRRDVEFWKDVSAQIASRAGVFREYLCTRDISGFDPMGWAQESAAKTEMKEASRGAVEQFAHDLVNNWDEYKRRGRGRCLYMVRELEVFWTGEAPRDDGWAITLGRCLRELGIHSLGQTKINGRNNRYVDLSARESGWDGDQIRAHIKKYPQVIDDKGAR